MTTLQNKQASFAMLVSRFIQALTVRGYVVTLGEAYRSPETAKMYAQTGKGIKNSLHTKRLAIDLNLFLEDEYLTTTEQYRVAGELWESYSIEGLTCCWGGRFGDGNHFSIEQDGIK